MTQAPFASLSKREKREYGRRLRLVWACQGDEREADAVERMIRTGAAIMRQRASL